MSLKLNWAEYDKQIVSTYKAWREREREREKERQRCTSTIRPCVQHCSRADTWGSLEVPFPGSSQVLSHCTSSWNAWSKEAVDGWYVVDFVTSSIRCNWRKQINISIYYVYYIYIYIWVKIVKLSSEKETQQSMSPCTSANYYFFHQKWAYFRRVPGFLE